jgi:hypothetical protein
VARKGDKLIFNRKLSRQGRVVVTKVWTPRRRRDQQGRLVWACRFKIKEEGNEIEHEAFSEEYIQSLVIAAAAVRDHFPDGEADEWIDKDGVSIWVLLPRVIPTGLGYEAYLTMTKAQDKALAEVLQRAEGKGLRRS